MNKRNTREIPAVETEYVNRENKVTGDQKRTGIETDVLKYIESRRLVWYGHVGRVENRWINEVTEWSPMEGD